MEKKKQWGMLIERKEKKLRGKWNRKREREKIKGRKKPRTLIGPSAMTARVELAHARPQIGPHEAISCAWAVASLGATECGGAGWSSIVVQDLVATLASWVGEIQLHMRVSWKGGNCFPLYLDGQKNDQNWSTDGFINPSTHLVNKKKENNSSFSTK